MFKKYTSLLAEWGTVYSAYFSTPSAVYSLFTNEHYISACTVETIHLGMCS